MTEIAEMTDWSAGNSWRGKPAPVFRWPQGMTADLSDRFEAFGRPGRSDRLSGGMVAIRYSVLGHCFARLGRFLGTPLAPWNGANVPVEVEVVAGREGVAWRRAYNYPGRAPVVVTSEKVVASDGSMLEVVGGCLAVLLSLEARGRCLRFIGRRYQLRLGRWRLPLPLWFTPGVLLAVHRAVGGDCFTFALAFRHPLFGVTHRQVGRFHHSAYQQEARRHGTAF